MRAETVWDTSLLELCGQEFSIPVWIGNTDGILLFTFEGQTNMIAAGECSFGSLLWFLHTPRKTSKRIVRPSFSKIYIFQ